MFLTKPKSILTVVLLLIFLRPKVPLFNETFAVYIGDLFIIIFVSIYFLLYGINSKYKWLYKNFCVFIIITMVLSLINFLLGLNTLNMLLNNFKLYLYYILLIFFLNVYYKIPNILLFFKRLLIFTFIVIFFIGTIQLFDIPYLSNITDTLYSTHKLRNIWTGYPRIFSTYYNANWFGVYLNFISLYMFSLIEYLKKQK